MDHSDNSYIAQNGEDPVPAVPPLPKATHQWPPSWLAEQPTVTPKPSSQVPRSHGWRLNNGTVICASCNPKPGNATAVILQDAADGPQWIEDPASSRAANPSLRDNSTSEVAPHNSTTTPTALGSDGSTSVSPQSLSEMSLGQGWL
jgi:hypothetical protein